MRLISKYLLCLAFLSLASACGSSSGTGLNMYSFQQEEEIGSKYAREIEKTYPMLNDPWLDNYVATLGRQLIVKGVPDAPFEYKFRVVNSPEVNAFAIPGGYLYVNVGLLKEAETEAELVGVWGHEIGHVVYRHGTKRMTDAALLQGLAVVAATGTEKSAGQDTSRMVGMGALLFGQMGLLKYGRNAELEADQKGLDILYATNYDAHAMAGFFKKLLALEQKRGSKGGGLTELFSTHPPTNERIQKCEERVNKSAPQPNPQLITSKFEEMKKRVAGLNPPPAKGR